jgi:carbon monoxide dehydrogenase subunit G
VLIENEFTVPQSVDALWVYLLDVERIAPCMPGAELTDTVDDHTWKGKVNAKFGPVSLSFAGTVTIQERDDVAHRVVLSAKGMEQKGKGAANATVTSWLEPGDGVTTVKLQADIMLSGAVAQLSRGLLPEVSKKLTQEFADCLQASMDAGGAAASPGAASPGSTSPGSTSVPASSDSPAPSSEPVAAKPVGGIGLGLSAIWSIIRGFFRKLFRRKG